MVRKVAAELPNIIETSAAVVEAVDLATADAGDAVREQLRNSWLTIFTSPKPDTDDLIFPKEFKALRPTDSVIFQESIREIRRIFVF